MVQLQGNENEHEPQQSEERDEFGRSLRTEEDLKQRLLEKKRSRTRPWHDNAPTHRLATTTTEQPEQTPLLRSQADIQAGQVVRGRIVNVGLHGAHVDILSREAHAQQIQHHGWLHISQLAPFRVDRVSDIVNRDDVIYCVVLPEDTRQLRHENPNKGPRTSSTSIRLSMIGVNQETGDYQASQQRDPREQKRHHNNNNSSLTGKYPRHMERRGQHRLDLLQDSLGNRSWMDDPVLEPEYMRHLWSSSPEPPAAFMEKQKEKRSREKDFDSESESGSSSSESSESSSETSSTSSSLYSRRRKRRHRQTRSRKSRRRQGDRYSRRDSRSRSSHRRRKRSRSSSSSSSSSESSTDESSSGSARDSRVGEASRKRHRKQSPPTTTISRDTKEHSFADHGDDKSEQGSLNATKLINQQERQHEQQLEKLQVSSDEDDDIGPRPPTLEEQQQSLGNATASDSKNNYYGKALLPGEGQALASFVQNKMRIPRRGEIGYQAHEIEQLEQQGYVMSGSRHARMNAVRIRKENQVYSAEEQRALALIRMQEKQEQEQEIMKEFRDLLEKKQTESKK